jgi:hypothetical protein
VYSKHFKRHKCDELTLDFGDEHDVPHFKEGIMRLRSFALGFLLDIPPDLRGISSSGAAIPGARTPPLLIRSSSSGAAILEAHPVVDESSLSDQNRREKINLMLKEEQGNLFLIDRFLNERDSAAQEALTSGEPLLQPQIKDEQSEESEEDENDEDMSSDESETEFKDIGIPPKLAEAAGFLISGRPFRLYKENLRAFIQPVQPTADSVGNPHSSIQARRTKESELLNLDYDIIFPIRFISSLQDMCKTGIEHLAGCQLSWWPLAEPEDTLRPNHVRIYSMPFVSSKFPLKLKQSLH